MMANQPPLIHLHTVTEGQIDPCGETVYYDPARLHICDLALQRIAFEVIAQAMDDARAETDNPRRQATVERVREDARAWLISPCVEIWFSARGMTVHGWDMEDWIERGCPGEGSFRERETDYLTQGR